MSFEIVITKEYDGVKPKSFLKKRVDTPYFKIPRLLKEKRITLNGKKIKEDTVLREGDIIKVWASDINPVEVKKYHLDSKDLEIPIIFENEDFIVFNKSSGIIVQGAQDNETSLSLHLAHYKQSIGDKSDFEYFHAHRLDKETSGILVVAKNRQTLRDLNQIFREKSIIKKYVCLCLGHFEKKEGQVEVFLRKNEIGVKEKMAICSAKEKDAERSLSIYKVLKEYEHRKEDFSLVEVEIKTGITHQIRVHMKSLGHPVLGDKLYGNSTVNREYENIINRQFLHAQFLEFEYKGKKYSFDAELTNDLKAMLEVLE